MDYLEVGINKEFFSSFKNKSDEFYKIFNLGMYKDFSFSHPNQKYLCNYKNYSNLVKKGKESEYREFCASYISEATRLINQRSEEITDKLSTILNNLNGEK